MKRRPKKRVAAIIIILAIAAYLVFTNMDLIFGSGKASQTLAMGEFQLYNWEETAEDSYISGDDAQIIIPGIDSNVDYLVIDCEISDLDPLIYFNTMAGKQFSEKNIIEPEYEYEDGKLTLQVNKYVYDMRIDLTSQSGVSLTIGSIQVDYHLKLQFDPVTAIIWLFILIILLIPLYLPRNFREISRAGMASFLRYRHLLRNLIHKDIVGKYRRSVLGMLWSVLNPLLMMLVITAVFENIFKVEMKDFPIYYLTGALIYNYVSEATNTSMTSILDASSLIKKVYIPKYIFPIEKCLSAFVNMLFSLIAVFLVFAIMRFQPSWTMFLIFIPMIYVMIFSMGLGMILATLNVFFRDTAHLYSVFLTAWMYLTPIIYPIEAIDSPIIVKIIKINPLYYFVDYFRALTMRGTIPSLSHNMICLCFSLVFLLAGAIIFKSNQNKFILHI